MNNIKIIEKKHRIAIVGENICSGRCFPIFYGMMTVFKSSSLLSLLQKYGEQDFKFYMSTCRNNKSKAVENEAVLVAIAKKQLMENNGMQELRIVDLSVTRAFDFTDRAAIEKEKTRLTGAVLNVTKPKEILNSTFDVLEFDAIAYNIIDVETILEVANLFDKEKHFAYALDHAELHEYCTPDVIDMMSMKDDESDDDDSDDESDDE
jgi:hypothetical protein